MTQRTRARADMSTRLRLSGPLVGGLCAVAASAAAPAASTAATPASLPNAASALQIPSASPSPTGPTPIDIGLGELANIELGALGLSSEQLAELISGLPESGGSAAELEPLIEALLGEPGATIGELLQRVEALLGGSETPAQLVQAVTEGATTPESLSGLLGGLAGSLGPEQLTGLEQILEKLIGGLSPTQLASLEEALGTSGSPSELAEDLTNELAGGGGTAALEALLGDLGSLLKTSGTQLAEDLGTPLETLADDLGVSTKSLTESAGIGSMLPGKEIFYVLGNGEEGITIGVTPPPHTTVSAGGSSPTPPASTVTTTTSSTTSTTPSTAPATTKKTAKVRIVREHVKKGVLTLVVKAPAAGTVAVHGKDLTRKRRHVRKAKTVTFKLRLTRAGSASLHRADVRDRKLKVRVIARFEPKSGPASKAARKVSFR